VSSKKDKLIESATRFIVRGQIDRAIKEYEQIVALEPGDVRNRQKLAELLVRENRKSEAIAEFTNVAQYYVKNSFYLKAIAVYKQIRKLDPDNPSIALALADLNLKQGLTGNAMVEFSDALALYERDRNLPEMQRVLQLMRDADPDNLQLRLREAEILLSLGRRDEACSAFVDLAVVMERQGKEIPLGQLEKRVKELFPDEPFFRTVAGRFMDEGDTLRAERYLRRAIDERGDDVEAWSLLVDCLEKRQDPLALDAALQEMIRRFPNDPAPRERLITRSLLGADPRQTLRLLESSSVILVGAGKTDLLIDAYRKVSALMPGDPAPLQALRDLLHGSGHPLLAEIEKELAAVPGAAPGAESLASAPEGAVDEAGFVDDESPLIGIEEEIVLSGLEDEEPGELPPEPSSQNDFSVDWESEGLDLGEIELIPAIPEPGGVSAEPSTPPRKQKRVKLGEDVDAGDVSTIYDLAIAYKEMGLYDEAIEQFEIVARDPQRRFDSMTLQGVCYREKGDCASAEKIFLKVLTLPSSRHERLCAQYELAEIYLQQGKKREALKLFREILDVDPDYRETTARVQQLESEDPERFLSDQLEDLFRETP